MLMVIFSDIKIKIISKKSLKTISQYGEQLVICDRKLICHKINNSDGILEIENLPFLLQDFKVSDRICDG